MEQVAQPQRQPAIQTRYLLHSNGRALWQEHKPLSQILQLQATTPPNIFNATYQGLPTAPEGTVFKRAFWAGKNRYDHTDVSLRNSVLARWQSWDTAATEKDTSAYTAMVEAELTQDYRLLVRLVYRERLEFPELPDKIVAQAKRANYDEKLRAIIIEDKSTGISALQTLRKSTSEPWVAGLLQAFTPKGDKLLRAQQAAVWCSNDCIQLPNPATGLNWLLDFEDELFDFPGSAYADQVDAFSQLILYTENLLEAGWVARSS